MSNRKKVTRNKVPKNSLIVRDGAIYKIMNIVKKHIKQIKKQNSSKN